MARDLLKDLSLPRVVLLAATIALRRAVATLGWAYSARARLAHLVGVVPAI